jgi:hypothetical protein
MALDEVVVGAELHRLLGRGLVACRAEDQNQRSGCGGSNLVERSNAAAVGQCQIEQDRGEAIADQAVDGIGQSADPFDAK